MNNKDKIKRLFTVMVDKKPVKYCELLTLSLNDLENMSFEFLHSYKLIFDKAPVRLHRALRIKVSAVNHCQEHLNIESQT